jgi:hypothetical protein
VTFQALTLPVLITWLNSIQPNPNSIEWPEFREGPYIHEMPDRLVTVTLLPGPGLSFEGLADQPAFQVRVRSKQNYQIDAETVSLSIDRAIFSQHFPQVFQGVNLMLVTRSAGQPAPLGPPDDAFRYDYVCTYRTVIGN